MIARAAQRYVLLLWALLLAGCAAIPVPVERASDVPARIELVDTPFFPQQAYQCGPAALATVMHVAGAPRSPDELRAQVYLPQRKGSLQIDLIGGIRRNALVPYRLDPSLDALFAEVAAGHPVVVFQNLGLRAFPVWHYAVVIGYDLERRVVILRSGEQARQQLALSTFARTWARAGHWAVLAQEPRRLPATAEEGRWLQAAVALEKAGQLHTAEQAYMAALTRWPGNAAALLGVGNTRYALGDWRGAAQAFRHAGEVQPQLGAAHNNLAHVLLGLRELDAALAAARRASTLGGAFAPVYAQTLEKVDEARRTETSPD